MKKLLYILLAAVVAIPLSAFTSLKPPVSTSGQGISQAVADAAEYRGTISAVTPTLNGLVVTLEQAKGTDFGADSLRFRITKDTRLSFERSRLAKGGYLSVAYGRGWNQDLDTQKVYEVISADLYPEAAMVNFNGIFQGFQPSETREGEGQFVMSDLETGQTVLYNYSPEYTQLYLNLDELVKGDLLNIFHRGIYTMSLPPQGSPLEIRRMAGGPAATFQGTVTQVGNGTALVTPDQGELIRRSGDRVSVAFQKDALSLAVGDRVLVGYSGDVMESYPLQVQSQLVVKLMDPFMIAG